MPPKEFWLDSASRALEKSTEECRNRIYNRLGTMAKYPDETVSVEIMFLREYIGNVLIESQPENGRKHKDERTMGQEAIETDLLNDFLENHSFPNLSPDLVSLYYFIARRQDGALSSEEIEIVESVRKLLLGLEASSPDNYEVPTESTPEVREFMSHLQGCIKEGESDDNYKDEACNNKAYEDAYKTIVKGLENGIIDRSAYIYSFRALAKLGRYAGNNPQDLYKKIDFLLSYFNAFLPTFNIKDITFLLQNLVRISYEGENRTERVSLLLDRAEEGFLMQCGVGGMGEKFGGAVSLLRSCAILKMVEHPIISSLVKEIHECLIFIRSLTKADIERIFHHSGFDMLHKVMVLHPDLFDFDDIALVRGKVLDMVKERPSTKTGPADSVGELTREILEGTCTVLTNHIDHELGIECDIFIAHRNAQQQNISLNVEVDGAHHDFSKLEDDFKGRICAKRGIGVVRIKNYETKNMETLRQKLTGIFKTMGLPVHAS